MNHNHHSGYLKKYAIKVILPNWGVAYKKETVKVESECICGAVEKVCKEKSWRIVWAETIGIINHRPDSSEDWQHPHLHKLTRGVYNYLGKKVEKNKLTGRYE